jgi:hypothetical protein
MKSSISRLAVSLLVVLLWAADRANAGQILTVQPIQVVDGVHPNPNVYLFQSEVNAIWGQADIQVRFLPTIQFNDPIYYNISNRTVGDRLLGVSVPDPAVNAIVRPHVVDVFFVNSLYFTPANGNAGLAVVGGNRIVMDTNFNSPGLGGVFAHEIGHNLGLEHVTGRPNLMNEQIGASTHLTEAQIALALATGAKLGLLTAAPVLAAAPSSPRSHDLPKVPPALPTHPHHTHNHSHRSTSDPPAPGASEFNAAPEPTSLSLCGIAAVMGLICARRRKLAAI